MRGSRKGKVFVMEQMTMVNEQVEVKSVETPEQVRSGSARMRELTPAQRRAVMFAQQQVLRARAAKKAKDEHQAALARMCRRKTPRPRVRARWCTVVRPWAR